MDQEAVIAAKWWADQLRGVPRHDAGDARLNFALAGMALLNRNQPTDGQILKFEAFLGSAIQQELIQSDSWRRAIEKDDSGWGSAFRTVATDYGPEPILRDALHEAGIKVNSGLLPVKTVMWVSPGSVRVSAGYRAEIVELMDSPNSKKVVS